LVKFHCRGYNNVALAQELLFYPCYRLLRGVGELRVLVDAMIEHELLAQLANYIRRGGNKGPGDRVAETEAPADKLYRGRQQLFVKHTSHVRAVEWHHERR